ncbi:MAG: hypothetical protein V9G19_04200 [Tetrasphaera sp.]
MRADLVRYDLSGTLKGAVADLTGHAVALLPASRRAVLAAAVTVDLDSTDVEVYGPTKQGVAYNYHGQRAGRPHLGTWAEAGLTLAAELLAGNEDVRPEFGSLIWPHCDGLNWPHLCVCVGVS